MSDEIAPSRQALDVPDLLAERFPGHTMQRLRTSDGKYRYLYVSAGVQSSFGMNPEALMQADAVDHSWVHAGDRRRFIEALETSARDMIPLDIEVRVEAPNGEYRWVRSLGQPRPAADGAVIWDGVALDITDRREALMALERTLSEARRSEVAEGRFNYIAAQDLVAPLDALRSAVTALSEGRRSDPAEISAKIDALTEKFRTFEKALSATRGLVSATSSDAPETTSPPQAQLTKRQKEVLDLMRAGATNLEIAQKLNISEGTVKLHVSAILKRTGARNRTEAALR